MITPFLYEYWRRETANVSCQSVVATIRNIFTSRGDHHTIHRWSKRPTFLMIDDQPHFQESTNHSFWCDAWKWIYSSQTFLALDNYVTDLASTAHVMVCYFATTLESWSPWENPTFSSKAVHCENSRRNNQTTCFGCGCVKVIMCFLSLSHTKNRCS